MNLPKYDKQNNPEKEKIRQIKDNFWTPKVKQVFFFMKGEKVCE